MTTFAKYHAFGIDRNFADFFSTIDTSGHPRIDRDELLVWFHAQNLSTVIRWFFFKVVVGVSFFSPQITLHFAICVFVDKLRVLFNKFKSVCEAVFVGLFRVHVATDHKRSSKSFFRFPHHV